LKGSGGRRKRDNRNKVKFCRERKKIGTNTLAYLTVVLVEQEKKKLGKNTLAYVMVVLVEKEKRN